MDGHFSDLLGLLKNGQKSIFFAAHVKKHFNNTTSHTYICTYTKFKVVKQLNPIGAMKKIIEPNCKLCLDKRLMIL